jgi:ubiquinone/menaquinone biosynthesis C-methylase UbiE
VCVDGWIREIDEPEEFVTVRAYDKIGSGYSRTRRADPRLHHAILEALGDTRSVANVGAGAGSYEPTDRDVIAVEPSTAMIAQRHAGAARVVRAGAEAMPFRDGSFEAGLAILTAHHWQDISRASGNSRGWHRGESSS